MLNTTRRAKKTKTPADGPRCEEVAVRAPSNRLDRVMEWLIVVIVIVVVIVLIINFWYVFAAIVGAYLVYRIIRYTMMVHYFKSDKFVSRANQVEEIVNEHNDIVQYASEISGDGSLEIGYSRTGGNAHLATTENTSRHAYRRDRNVAHLTEVNVHNCSLQVVRKAAEDPIKYLIKYFGISTTEDEVKRLEGIADRMSRLENAVDNLHERERAIETDLTPPKFILKHYHEKFMDKVGVDLSPIDVPYPEYRFEYVSAGGNSSQKTDIKVTTDVMDELISTVSDKVKYRASAAGQRALMTSAVRERIKSRDNYTCRSCGVSLSQEPHLLLEVDHIFPVSKGGLSVDENLQTLCWRCNRSKSNKLPVIESRQLAGVDDGETYPA
ncbi:HNH endonuclease [Cutibacterium sp. V970]|uniref:HNH endonuclease n=1 Tax=Cutibacterium sp. V970 TaxID=3446481 RepID=UPI003EE28058